MNNLQLAKEVTRIVQVCCFEKGYVSMIDVLLHLKYVTSKDVDDWRFGKVEFLEQRCQVNLNKLSLIHRLLRENANKMKLKSSWTGYNQFGKRVKRPLRFSKSGDLKIEENYATHFVDLVKMKELKLS